MTPLRRRMTEDMQVRNFSPHTQDSYVQQVSLFARHFSKSPEVLGPEEIRFYQVYLTNEKKLAPSSILIAVSFANPYLIPELIMNPVPEPGEPPKTKVMVHGLPGSKFTRQHAPTDAAFEHIKDGIRNLAQINSPLSSFGFRCWKQRLNQRPLRRRQIARIGKLIHPTTILHAFSDRF